MTHRNHIFLYGAPGSGKSFLGEKLALALALNFVDLDHEIEKSYGKAIPDIFRQEGEDVFRRLESEALLKACQSNQISVVALGGGALLKAENAEFAARHGKIIVLSASEESLLQNISSQKNDRPLLAGDSQIRLHELVEERSEHYSQFPTIQVDGQTAEESVALLQVQAGCFRITGMGAAYAVEVNTRILQQAGQILQREGLRGPVLIVSDDNVAPLYAESVQKSLNASGYDAQLLVLPAGEMQKNLAAIEIIWQAALSAGLERSSTILALGGGVVSDLAGFAAATYMRGIRWVVCPTSLLAMVDASLGGKTGFDLPQGKNLVGAFHSPALVLADPLCLQSLPLVEIRNGMAEVLKHGIISSAHLLELSCQPDWQSKLGEIVPLAMRTKINVLRQDPYERGVRAVLNFGHTIGHAIELVSGFTLRHGEAVAIGMLVETRLAVKMGLAEDSLPLRIEECLSFHSLPTNIPAGLETDAILKAMTTDKKKTAGEVKFVLPQRVGEVSYGHGVDLKLVSEVIESIRA